MAEYFVYTLFKVVGSDKQKHIEPLTGHAEGVGSLEH